MAKSPPPEDPNKKLVDDLLKGLPHAQPDHPGGQGGPGASRRPAVTRTPQVGRARVVDRPPPLAVWLRVGLAVALAGAITQWPYARDCGWPLIGYGSAVVLVLATSLWASVFSWRGQIGIAHLLAQGALLFSLGLAASVVLPRVGYAADAAVWRCGSLPAEEPPSTPATPPVAAPIVPAPPGDSLAADSLATADSTATDSVPGNPAPADSAGGSAPTS